MLNRNMIAVVLAFSIGVVLGPRLAEAQEAESEDGFGLTALDSLLSIPVSSASKYEQAQEEAPASISILTREDFERYGWRTLSEALSSLPGFYSTYDRSYEFVGARGFSRPSDYNNRFLLLIDGHRYNDNFYDAAATGTDLVIGLESVDRIEVVRGPGSVVYGNSAMFGVINVIPRAGSTIQGATVVANGGSYGTASGSVVGGSQFGQDAEFMISATFADVDGQDLYYPEFDDPGSNFGMAEGIDYDRRFGFFGTFRWSDLKFQGSVGRRTKAVPTAPWETLFNTEMESTDERWWAELRYDRDLSAKTGITVLGSADYYGFEGDYPYEDGMEFDQNRSNWFGAEARFRWDPVAINRLEVGAEYRYSTRAYYVAGSADEIWTEFDNDFSIASLYVNNAVQLTRTLALTLGLRGDYYSTTQGTLTPRAAAVYHPADHTSLKLLYGQAYRAPNQNEFYYEEPDFWATNPDIRPETIRTLEFVWQQQLGKVVTGSASLFRYEVDDLIDTVEDEEGVGMYDNLESVDANGFEVDLTARASSGLSAFGNYTFQKATGTDDVELTNSPAHLVRMGVSVPVAKRTFLSAEARYESPRLTVEDTRTDDFTVVNLTLFTRELPGVLKGSLSVRNVFDTDYANPGGWEHTQASIAQNGRHFLIMLGAEF